jgi:hypothetical protein
MTGLDRSHVEDGLRRIDGLVRTLAGANDPRAQETARALLEAVLDIHGLALARIAATLSASAEGQALLCELAADEHVKAILLLHGLHPDSAEDRLRAAIGALETQLGVAIALVSVRDGVAHLSVQPGPNDWTGICQEIGRALLDAAPDLDDIAIDRARVPGAELLAAAG